jgi:hypothetical protein
MASFMKIDFEKNKELKQSVSELIKEKLSSILKELNSLEHLDDFAKIIMICLSKKFEGNEKKMREEFVDVFDKREDLTDNFIVWLKQEIPKQLEKHANSEESQKKEEAPKKEKKSILDRVRLPEKSKRKKNEKDDSRKYAQKKRNYREFEDDYSDSDDYEHDQRSRLFISQIHAYSSN